MAAHSGSAAYVSFGYRTGGSAVQCRQHMLRLHVKAVDVVEATIVGLGDDGETPGLHVRSLNEPLKDRVPHHAYTVRIRYGDRPLEQSRFLQPGGTSHLTVAVEREPGAEHRIGARLAAWMHHRNPRAHRTLAHHQSPLSVDERRVAYLHPRNVRDGIQWTRHTADQGTDT